MLVPLRVRPTVKSKEFLSKIIERILPEFQNWLCADELHDEDIDTEENVTKHLFEAFHHGSCPYSVTRYLDDLGYPADDTLYMIVSDVFGQFIPILSLLVREWVLETGIRIPSIDNGTRIHYAYKTSQRVGKLVGINNEFASVYVRPNIGKHNWIDRVYYEDIVKING